MAATTSPSSFDAETFFMQMPLPQMQNLKTQFQKELSILQESFTQLRAAQSRFQVSLNALQDSMNASNQDKEVMIPLTSTLYVAGNLVNPEKVLVDVGTGYFVEKTCSDATDYYNRKIEFLKSQLEKLQSTIVAKRSQMQIFMDIYQLKMSRLASSAKPEAIPANA